MQSRGSASSKLILLRLAGALLIALASDILFVGTFVQAQQALNEHCVVSILNRTAQVRADGSWDLPNVPAGFGPVRARATCVENGITRSGESALFTILPGRMNAIPPIILGPTTPIPSSLSITSGLSALTQVGQTTQLTVTARYPGVDPKDVTAASTGTLYTTTNAGIAGVTAGGVITAVRSGTVIIRATNEGTAGLFSVKVQLSGDSDGDGIPDDVELANGLNPNNPVDALEDADHDGLSNLAEYNLGTNIRNADTDGDGIPDGEEVIPGVDGFITNPLLADSDGDGVNDGLEIASGSDPNNPASLNLAAALNGIDVAPTTFELTVNAVIGEAARQLVVTGRLKDGHSIDLTSTLRGTNYASSDLNICNFGAQDGRVFAGSNGACTITVTNAGFSAQAQGTVQSFTPVPLSFVSIPGFANNVDVSGDFAYVAAGASGLQVVNVANRTSPVVVAAIDTPGNANDVAVVGTLAFVADGTSGLRIIDVSNPLAPANVGAFDTPGEAWDVVVRDNKAYVADGASGLQIIDVSVPSAPRLLGSVDPPGIHKGVDVDVVRSLAVMASGTSGIHVVDVSNPAAPAIVGSVSTSGDARDVALKGNFAIVADFSRSMTTVDISVPTAPQVRASTPQNLGGLLQDVTVAGNFALGADVVFVNGVPIVDISDPANPVPRAILNFSNFRDDNATGIAVDSSYVYLTAERGISENGTSGDTRLYIGQYLSREDRAGIAPTVRITAPANGSIFVEGSSVPVRVDAVDDIAVVGVTFLVNGQPAFTDTSFPYEFSVPTQAGASSVTIGARAVDLGGNIGTAEPVQIGLIPDPLTTVTGRVIDRGGAPVGGATVTVLGREGTTAADGTFSIPNVPTVTGSLVVSASALIEGRLANGSSKPKSPVLAGVTAVGDIRLRGGRILFLWADVEVMTALNEISSVAAAAGMFTAADVDTFDVRTATPTLDQLQGYSSVLVWSDYSYFDSVALGNVLADFVDQGGGVVTATFSHYYCCDFALGGRLVTGGYVGFVPGGSSGTTTLSLANSDTTHPIMQGVTGNLTFTHTDVGYSLTAGATVVARDTVGVPKVAIGPVAGSRVVSVAIYPGYSSYPLQPSIARLFANAIDFVR